MRIDGEVALVTGGAGGLGEIAARALAEAGADVVILDRDAERAAQVAAEIGGYSVPCDIAEAEEVAVGVSTAMARFDQRPRIVLDCARMRVAAPVLGPEGKVSIPIFRRTVEVNLIGAHNLVTYAAQALMDAPPLAGGLRGVILCLVPDTSGEGRTAETSAAAGIESLCAAATRDLAWLGIKVAAIAEAPEEAFLASLWHIIEEAGGG